MVTTQLLEHPDIMGAVEYIVSGTKLRERRELLGWSQPDLAEKAGVHVRTVQNAETGHVRDGTLRRLLAAVEEGERQAERDEHPDLETWTLEIDGVRVVVTGERGKLAQLDLNSFIRPRTN